MEIGQLEETMGWLFHEIKLFIMFNVGGSLLCIYDSPVLGLTT